MPRRMRLTWPRPTTARFDKEDLDMCGAIIGTGIGRNSAGVQGQPANANGNAVKTSPML